MSASSCALNLSLYEGMVVVFRTVNSRRFGFVERNQVLLLVNHLHAKSIFVHTPAADRLAILGHRAHAAVRRQNIVRRDRSACGAAGQRFVACQYHPDLEPRAGPFPFTAWQLLQFPAPWKSACPRATLPIIRTLRVKAAHVAKVGNDSGQFRCAKREWLHRRARNSVGDCGPQIVVGHHTFECAGAKVDAWNQIARRAVARRALSGKNLRAVLNVRGIVDRSAILPLRGYG